MEYQVFTKDQYGEHLEYRSEVLEQALSELAKYAVAYSHDETVEIVLRKVVI